MPKPTFAAQPINDCPACVAEAAPLSPAEAVLLVFHGYALGLSMEDRKRTLCFLHRRQLQNVNKAPCIAG